MVGTGARTQIKHATQQTHNTQGFTVKLFVPHLYKRYHISYTTFLKVETFHVEAMGFSVIMNLKSVRNGYHERIKSRNFKSRRNGDLQFAIYSSIQKTICY